MSAKTYINKHLPSFAQQGTLNAIVDTYNKHSDKKLTSELQWLIDRCDNTHNVKTFVGTLPYDMMTKLKVQFGESGFVFGDDVVYQYRVSFGHYVNDQTKVNFSYETMSFADFFGA